MTTTMTIMTIMTKMREKNRKPKIHQNIYLLVKKF